MKLTILVVVFLQMTTQAALANWMATEKCEAISSFSWQLKADENSPAGYQEESIDRDIVLTVYNGLLAYTDGISIEVLQHDFTQTVVGMKAGFARSVKYKEWDQEYTFGTSAIYDDPMCLFTDTGSSFTLMYESNDSFTNTIFKCSCLSESANKYLK